MARTTRRRWQAVPKPKSGEMIRDIHRTITEGTGAKPRGWLGPALSETHNTLDLLAETGFDYCGDWVND